MKEALQPRPVHAEPRSTRWVSISGTGSYLPKRVLTNAELESMIDTSDDWIFSRTGMRERRIARKDETTSDMASQAAKAALDDAGIAPKDVDVLLVATCTPDMFLTSTACLVQNSIGSKKAFCMDLSAACSGFLYAMEVGQQFIASGNAETVLVIGAEKMSCITDWEDRTTCVLFGDGAGAAVLRPSNGEQGRILKSVLGSDGALGDLLMVPGGGSKFPATEETVQKRLHYIKMKGREVFKYAVTNMANAAKSALKQTGHTIDDVSCIIPHQANARIIQAIGQRIGAHPDKFFINVDKYGNTSAASIIVAINEAANQGRIVKGDLVLLVAFGAGFTWGATVLEW